MWLDASLEAALMLDVNSSTEPSYILMNRSTFNVINYVCVILQSQTFKLLTFLKTIRRLTCFLYEVIQVLKSDVTPVRALCFSLAGAAGIFLQREGGV